MRLRHLAAGSAGRAGATGCAAFTVQMGYAPLPDRSDLLNPDEMPLAQAYDVLGRAISADEARQLRETAEGRHLLSPAAGAVPVDDPMVRLGREAFYREAPLARRAE